MSADNVVKLFPETDGPTTTVGELVDEVYRTSIRRKGQPRKAMLKLAEEIGARDPEMPGTREELRQLIKLGAFIHWYVFGINYVRGERDFQV
jgi:hypothetical protein